MLRTLYYRLRYGSYLKNDHGIKKFAERAMSQLIRKVTKKSANYRELNENMLVEKANLRLRADELQENRMLDAGEFFSMRRRLLANLFIVISFIAAAVFLNVVSVASVIEGDTAVLGTLRWVAAALLAVVLTGGGLIVTERLIETILSDTSQKSRPAQTSNIGLAILWAALLIGIEMAIYGFSTVRAAQFAATQGAGSLYLGYVTLALLLPILAGAVRWDAMRHIDLYKTTQTLREVEGRLAQIDSLLRQNEEYESNFYKLKSISYWDTVNEFKTYKDNYNRKNGISEGIGGHFSQSYDAFQAEADKRYEADIRDITAKSMRKLKQTERTVGHKLGQRQDGGGEPKSSQGASLPMPAAGNPPRNGDGRPPVKDAEETYLEPQPVR